MGGWDSLEKLLAALTDAYTTSVLPWPPSGAGLSFLRCTLNALVQNSFDGRSVSGQCVSLLTSTEGLAGWNDI